MRPPRLPAQPARSPRRRGDESRQVQGDEGVEDDQRHRREAEVLRRRQEAQARRHRLRSVDRRRTDE